MGGVQTVVTTIAIAHRLYAGLYNEQFEGGRVQWCCEGGDVMADGSVRERKALPA